MPLVSLAKYSLYIEHQLFGALQNCSSSSKKLAEAESRPKDRIFLANWAQICFCPLTNDNFKNSTKERSKDNTVCNQRESLQTYVYPFHSSFFRSFFIPSHQLAKEHTKRLLCSCGMLRVGCKLCRAARNKLVFIEILSKIQNMWASQSYSISNVFARFQIQETESAVHNRSW